VRGRRPTAVVNRFEEGAAIDHLPFRLLQGAATKSQESGVILAKP
jgi:hypothetical protein